MAYKTIQFIKKETIGIILLDRPQNLNAINIEMSSELLDVLKKCAWDDEIRVLVLAGKGKAFSSGGDIRDIKDALALDAEDSLGKMVENLTSSVNQVLLAIRKMKKPVIAALHGFSSGGGAGLALACDLIIAAKSAKLHIPQMKIGLVPDGGNSFFWVQKLGRYKAAELYLTAEPLGAEEAYKLGIVTKLVSDEDLRSYVEEFAKKLALGPIHAIALTKNLLDQAYNNNLETQLEQEKDFVVKCSRSEEFKEGITAFLEKRPPEFVKS